MDSITIDKAQFGNGRTVMVTLPLPNGDTRHFELQPNPKDIAVLIPRRWQWLDKLLGNRIEILKAGDALEATSNGKRWQITFYMGA